MKVAIPNHKGEVAPCFEYTAAITIYTIRKNRIIDQVEFALQSKQELDRIRLLRDQGVTALICSGIQAAHEGLLLASGIQVISWISGNISEVLPLFLKNRLAPGTACHEASRELPDSLQEEGKADS